MLLFACSRSRIIPPALEIALLIAGAAFPTRAQAPGGNQDASAPKAALSACPSLEIVAQESVPAGTALAVSADGRFRATWVHTGRGAELELLDRSSGEKRRIALAPTELAPGVTWRVIEATFSPASQWLAVRSIGAIWVLDSATAQVLYTIGVDSATQTYPGKLTWSGSDLAVAFWPPESFLADAVARKPVEVRLYDAASGRIERRLNLHVPTSDQWAEPRLSPDAARLAVLERARRWPGSSRLVLFAADTGKPIWERKIKAEDIVWTADGKQLLALGPKLIWLDAETGKFVRRAATSIHFTEFQKLRVSEPAQTALGELSQYNPLKRTFQESKPRISLVVVWRLDTGRALCEVHLSAATGVEAWLTGSGELLALEEAYEVRPPLRLLKSARIVTYRLKKP